MTNKIIEKLEARIKELETKCEVLENDLDELTEENAKMAKLARAICEIQEHLRDTDRSFILINRINAPTRVGHQ